jgi:serine/threonine protein kinase
MRPEKNRSGDSMNRMPEQQWSALSALYEEADALPVHALPAWLARLEAEGHPLVSQLKRMLEARAQMETDDFLGTLPKLSTTADASAWSAGRRVGPYRLVRPLGEGGMAEVWLAERDDGAFKRQVAIKLPYPRPGRETFAARFDRERDILATLRHPHIAGLFDAGVTPEGQAWLALEYVEGQQISIFCDDRRLSVRERVLLFRQVLLAVQHAHANLVIHRDLKPGNILVTPQGEVRLLDFGIAKLLEAQGDAIEETELTRQSGRSMTPRYASPEQLMGLPLTTACDVYSLGVVFYELMCGERPYELKVESPAQLEHAILEVEPRAMSRRGLVGANAQARGVSVKALRRQLAPELDAIALRCLEKKASARYASVDAVLADLDRWLAGEAVLARSPGAWYRFWKFTTRHRLAVGLSVSAVLALAVTAAVAVVLGMQAREESARAGAARDFMLSLFKRADQEKARGADITARELLETGRKDVLTRLAGQPRLQAELLQGIATIQKDMGEYVGADTTYADAARVYRQLGMSREAALARTAEANVGVRMGNLNLAKSALQQAKEALDRKDDPEVNARMKEVEGWVAVFEGQMELARSAFEQSHADALRAFGPYHPKTMDTLRGRIYAEQNLRNFDGALGLLELLEKTASKTSGLDARELAALARDRAELLYSAGHPAELLGHVLPALAKCIADLGPNDLDCRELVFRKVDAMLQLGMTQRAAQDLPVLEQIAADRTSPQLAVDALLLILRIESAVDAPSGRPAAYERVQVLLQREKEAALGPALRAKVVQALAMASLRDLEKGNPDDFIEDSLREQGSKRSSLFGARARLLKGIRLFQQQHVDEALSAFTSARDDLVQVVGAEHPLTQRFSLHMAVAMERLGRVDEARAIVAHAEPILRKAMGPDAPAYLRVLDLRSRLGSAGSRSGSELKSTDNRPPTADLLTFYG